MPVGRRSVLSAAAASFTLVAVSAVTGCSTGPAGGSAAPATSAGTASAAADSYPVTIKHAFGQTTITEAPTRIATLGVSDPDVVAALGQVPVGVSAVTWGGNAKKSTDWFDAAVTKLGGKAPTQWDETAGAPIDAIAAVQPDLILGVNSGLTKAEYDKLSKIAPVVAYPESPWSTPMETSVDTIGKALGRSTEATALTAEANKQLDAAIATYPQIKGKTFAWASFAPNDLSVISLYTSRDLRPQIARRLGMADAPAVVQLTKANPGVFFANYSAEKSSSLEADIFAYYTGGGIETAALKKNPLISQIPALKGNRYVAVGESSSALAISSPTPLSLPVITKDFLPKLASAAEGKPAT